MFMKWVLEYFPERFKAREKRIILKDKKNLESVLFRVANLVRPLYRIPTRNFQY